MPFWFRYTSIPTSSLLLRRKLRFLHWLCVVSLSSSSIVCTRSPHSLTSWCATCFTWSPLSAWISCCLGRDFFLWWWWWWWCLWFVIKLLFFTSIWFSRRTCSFLCLLRLDSVLRDDSIWIGQAMPRKIYRFTIVAFINLLANSAEHSRRSLLIRYAVINKTHALSSHRRREASIVVEKKRTKSEWNVYDMRSFEWKWVTSSLWNRPKSLGPDENDLALHVPSKICIK